MNLHARLNALQRERSRRCSACGGPLVLMSPPGPRTWRAAVKGFTDLPDEERIAFHAGLNLLHKLPPALQEKAYHMYCNQQGIKYEGSSCPYSSPDPPPAPWFPEEDVPVPKVQWLQA